jgi:hypothetical protein
MDSTPLLNLLIEEEESRLVNSQDELMCPFERWFIEYIDKSFHMDEIIPTNKEIEILMKHNPTRIQQLIVPVESINQQSNSPVEIQSTSYSTLPIQSTNTKSSYKSKSKTLTKERWV